MNVKLMREAGILAACLFVAVIIVWLFGEDQDHFWYVVAWTFVLAGIANLAVRL